MNDERISVVARIRVIDAAVEWWRCLTLTERDRIRSAHALIAAIEKLVKEEENSPKE